MAGLNLAALSLRETGDRAESMARMPVDDRFLVDYLWDEVAARQTPEMRDFLLQTSVLERLCGPLCDAVAERRDSADMLLELERSNLFVIAARRARRWFRYHHLFRAMLLRQLERYAPERVADLHRRASAWFADRGDVTARSSTRSRPATCMSPPTRCARTGWRCTATARRTTRSAGSTGCPGHDRRVPGPRARARRRLARHGAGPPRRSSHGFRGRAGGARQPGRSRARRADWRGSRASGR